MSGFFSPYIEGESIAKIITMNAIESGNLLEE